MLQVKGVHTKHGWNHVLKGIDFKISKGSIVAIVGSNGAGKSTLLGTIAGIYKCFQGEILLDGTAIQQLSPEKAVRQGVCLVPEGRHIFAPMTVEENLLLGAYHRWGVSRKSLKDEINKILTLFPDLAPRRKDPAGGLSGGMQQMLAIGRGLMAKPKVMLLDEPSLGLAPLLVKEILTTLHRLREKGTTILLVEQNAKAAMQVSDWVYVLDHGRIVLDGKPDELRKDPRVQQAYLGRGYSKLAAST